MNLKRIAFTSVFTAILLAGVFGVFTVALEVRGEQSPSAPDNSKQNAHETRTADDQPNDKADRLTAAQVRKAIVADKALSTYAHNIKVIVMGGKVTLEGPVHTEAERQQLLADVAAVVEAETIINKITVI